MTLNNLYGSKKTPYNYKKSLNDLYGKKKQ